MDNGRPPEIDHDRALLIGASFLADESFRDWLLRDPEAAAASLEIRLEEMEIQVIRSLDPEIVEALADRFNELILPMRWGD